MTDSAVVDAPLDCVPVSDIVQETEGKKAIYETKQPGVWAKVYQRTSKEGKPAAFGRFCRYRKTDSGYEDSPWINSLSDCENMIEVLYDVKKFMRQFYTERES